MTITKKRRKRPLGEGGSVRKILEMPNTGGRSPMGAMRDIPIDSVKTYPGNARRGDIESIMESLQYHGQYKPIVVQKSTDFILAGNHTWQAAKKLGWEKISAVFVDVDDKQAKKIVLVDNATNDAADYNNDALYELLSDLEDPIGSGYTQDVLDNLDQIMEDIRSGVEDNGGATPKELQGRSNYDPDADPEDVDDFDELSDVMKGVSSLKADAIFETDDYWGIPDLIPDMCFDHIDDPIDTWSGPTSSTDDGKSLYMYVYGTDSTKGMPWDRTLLSFYTSDSRQENWWADPAKYTAKMLNAGIAAAIQHDFSLFAGLPRATHLWNTYRIRWLSRYMQEAGIKIIPGIQYADLSSLEFCNVGIPIGTPVLATQMQTVEDVKDKDGHRSRTIREKCIRQTLEDIEPEQLIVYGSKPGFEFMEDLKLPVELIFVENRSVRRSRWQKQRDAAVYRDPSSRKKSSRVTGISQTGVAMRDR